MILIDQSEVATSDRRHKLTSRCIATTPLKTGRVHKVLHWTGFQMLHDSSVGTVELISSVVGKSSSISSPSTLGVNNSTSMGLRRPKGRKHTQLSFDEC